MTYVAVAVPQTIPFPKLNIQRPVNDSNFPDQWTLSESFEQINAPELVSLNRKPQTFAEYRLHLSRWEDYWSSSACKYRMMYPLLATIGRQDLIEFRQYLQQWEPVMTNRTVNKHLGSLLAVLDAAVRHEIILSAPRLKPLPSTKIAQKLYLHYDEMSRLYDACEIAMWPTRDRMRMELSYSPVEAWRAALVLYFNYGFRSQELIRMESTMPTLCWRNISWTAETPSQCSRIQNKHGWLHYVPEKQKRNKPNPLILPLNAVAAAHLRMLVPKEKLDLETPIFNWPMTKDMIYSQWRAICDEAGVRPKPDLKTGKQGHFLFKHLRKTCTTWHNFHRPGIAPFVTGHADRDGQPMPVSQVSTDHYDNGEMSVVRAVNDLPQPESFVSGLASALDGKQSFLIDGNWQPKVDLQKRLF